MRKQLAPVHQNFLRAKFLQRSSATGESFLVYRNFVYFDMSHIDICFTFGLVCCMHASSCSLARIIPLKCGLWKRTNKDDGSCCLKRTPFDTLGQVVCPADSEYVPSLLITFLHYWNPLDNPRAFPDDSQTSVCLGIFQICIHQLARFPLWLLTLSIFDLQFQDSKSTSWLRERTALDLGFNEASWTALSIHKNLFKFSSGTARTFRSIRLVLNIEKHQFFNSKWVATNTQTDPLTGPKDRFPI